MSHYVVEAFDALGGDYAGAVESAGQFSSVNGWVASQAAQAGVVGAAAMAVPGGHLAAMAADVGVLIHKMAYCSWGIGSIVDAPVEGKDDIAIILALWSGELSQEELPRAIMEGTERGGLAAIWLASAQAATTVSPTLAQIAVVAVANNPALAATAASKGLGMVAALGAKKAGVGPLTAKAASKATSMAAQYVAANAASSQIVGTAVGHGATMYLHKAAAKIGAKFSSKMSAKALAGFVPFVGPTVGAGVNAYFVKHMGDSAVAYYEAKRRILAQATIE